MTGQLWFPGADTTTQRFDDDYAGIKWTGPAEKVCIHTTETTSWPDYGGGKSAPNFTGKPDFANSRITWRQHFPANMSARALQNDSGGVETNKDKVIQIELIGTCDPVTHGRWTAQHIFTPEAPDWWLQEVARLIKWTHDEHGIELVAPSLWLPYDDSYGNSSARMSGSTFNSFRGVLGHMHVAENDHGDPGAINIKSILNYAKGGSEASNQEDDMPKLSDKVTVAGAAYDFVVSRGAVPSPNDPAKRTGQLPYKWFVVWGYIETVQNNEALEKNNELLRAIAEAQPNTQP
jgi:hypothetical protein